MKEKTGNRLWNRDEIDNTEALIRAVEDPTFTILGHPTGRILQVREGFPIFYCGILLIQNYISMMYYGPNIVKKI